MSDLMDLVELIVGGIVVLAVIITVLLITGILTFHDLQWAYSPYKGLFYILMVFFIAIGLTVMAAKLWEHFS